MMNSDTILSQDAIDALLAGSGSETSNVTVANDDTRSIPEQPSRQPAGDVNEAAIPVVDDGVITLEKVIEIAGQAAEAETAPVHDSISRIYQRVGYLEQALARISQLEAEVKSLKQNS
jgi:hypothetical protein